MYDLARQLARCLSVGPKTIVAKSFGGKGSKLHVDTEETISFMEAKASKKLDFKPPHPGKIFYRGKELEDDKSLLAQNKTAPNDQTSNLLPNENRRGSLLALDPADKSPFLGEIIPGSTQSSLETNMFRSPVFPHKVSSTDYLFIRSAKQKLSIRRIDNINVVGQQRGPTGQWIWKLRSNVNIPSEEVLRKHVPPEKVCVLCTMSQSSSLEQLMHGRFELFYHLICQYSLSSEQSSLYRLKHLGITRLMNPTGIASAMSQLPNEAIALAAASHGERERQITPWTLSTDFVACTNQKKATVKSTAVIGTDADLRRLSMEAAGEVLQKFNVSDEIIAKRTRWHRITMIRELPVNKQSLGSRLTQRPSTNMHEAKECHLFSFSSRQGKDARRFGTGKFSLSQPLRKVPMTLSQIVNWTLSLAIWRTCLMQRNAKMELTKKKKAGPARKEGGLVGPHLGFGSENVEHNKRPSSKLPVQLSLTRLTILWRTFRGQNGCK
ncbi:hypothetical protein CDL15_Pgr011925 [Punica granatum]|uniref:Ubiquitin-like domain-containing protein n=1 Tax=Punica granatum TaxID=22663 RepID=A0A218WD97_PUNGR|nr:hypothetical protein CDL15_Pgr011925 [Punica granatum]